MRLAPGAALAPLLLLLPRFLAAQDLAGHAQAVPAWIRAAPLPRDDASSELRVLQPMLSGRAAVAGGRLALLATLNLAGGTIEAGELAPGNWGEGFVDRRHPHTWAHELLAAASAGDGLAPRLPHP